MISSRVTEVIPANSHKPEFRDDIRRDQVERFLQQHQDIRRQPREESVEHECHPETADYIDYVSENTGERSFQGIFRSRRLMPGQ
jgi:hypothetical protein